MRTVRSERLGAELHLGKLPAEPLRAGTVRFSEIRPALEKAGVLPKPPHMFGHGHDFSQGLWLMLGNGPLGSHEGGLPQTWNAARQGCGDCTIAGPAHEVMEAARNAGLPIPEFSAETVIKQYMERTHAANGAAYNPEDGEGDTGLMIQDVNQWRQEEGIADDAGTRHKLVHAVALEPGNVQELWEAAWLFERVGIGIVVTEAQMHQFDKGPQPVWDYVAGSPELGGHYVPVMGKLGLISWAEDVYYTPRFIEHQCDEAFASFELEEFEAVTGDTLEHFSQADLEKFAVLLAEKKMAAL
jgi:hypothetical protein